MFGYVLTGAHTFEEVYKVTKILKADTLKVVTAWGLNWNDKVEGDRRALICSLTPNTVIRTKAGDPSSNGTLHPVADEVIAEIIPWYAVKRDIIIEIGNEPNTYSSEPEYIYIYRWYLAETIQRLRTFFPHAQIISTALQPTKNVKRWYEIFNAPDLNIYTKVDYIGVHAYEHTSFLHPQTGDISRMQSIFQKYTEKLFWTELGINGANPKKIEEYRQISLHNPVTYYHYNSFMDVDANYHVIV